MPEFPLASRRTVSLVLMSPSIVIRLKEFSTASFRIFCNVELGAKISVVRNANIVAMLGSIIPAPLTTPPIVISPREHSIFAEHDLVQVSEVRIASWKARAPSHSSLMSSLASLIPVVRRLMGSGTPILPVEQTRTSLEWMFKCLATSEAIFLVSSSPCFPVQAFALPLFATMA